MTRGVEDLASSSEKKYCTVQPERNLEANFEVDIAKKLEDYLVKISGTVTNDVGDGEGISVNFAEAALLIQGSAQVYSRKVEYLYSLVLQTLEFLSQKRQQEQADGASLQPEGIGSPEASIEESDEFWVSDDIKEEPKNRLDNSAGRVASFNRLAKAPANLLVLEAECLDTTGTGGELDTSLMASCFLYRDFHLLNPHDYVSVDEFLGRDKANSDWSGANRDSSAHKNCQSPARYSGGTGRQSSARKNQDANFCQSPLGYDGPEPSKNSVGFDPSAFDNYEDHNQAYDMNDRHSEPGNPDDTDDDNDDNPWKPLNPHEPGNLKVKPFRKVKTCKVNWVSSAKQNPLAEMFPLAKLHGTISPDLTELWEARCNVRDKQSSSSSPPLYEKLRQSLTNEVTINDAFLNPMENEDDGFNNEIPDYGPPEYDMPEKMVVDEDFDDGAGQSDNNEAFAHENADPQASLEDLCNSHLEALLANIADTEQQTEMAARVSTWKQKIERDLEEQEQHPPFDIHVYGERIVNKLSDEAEGENVMPFSEVVKGQEKHDVARSFSALLQLVNNGDVDLDKGAVEESVCYTGTNPFHVRLKEKRPEKRQFRMSKKRVKTPRKPGSARRSPDGKRRRRSPSSGPVESTG